MRAGIFVLSCALLAQSPDPAYEPLAKAYEALRNRDYDTAIPMFLKGIGAAPGRASIRKDLAYAYLKIGENELARDQFREAMRIDPADFHATLEYAFLCYETRQKAVARRIFDRVRQTGDPQSRATAEQAFRNVDGPLAEGIARWTRALAIGPDNFSAHYELATFAEQRDELELAAGHYEKAWRLLPDRRGVLVDLGRVWKALNRVEQANAALLAASRGGEPRAAEQARELLPERYPYVPEFRQAIAFDPANIELRRELAYLFLKMGRQAEAEQEFRTITERDVRDLLSAAQLGFLYLGRGDRVAAVPLLQRVLSGDDDELSNRVRAVLRLPQALRQRSGDTSTAASVDAKDMAERSIRAGYMKDALRYLQIAHEADPADFAVMLKMGWTYNILHDDALAYRWFDLARNSPDAQVSGEALRAFRNLHRSFSRVRISGWMFPLYSSRWRDLFSYGQIKADFKSRFWLQPYAGVRFIGDSRRTEGSGPPQYLSESAFVLAVGARTGSWHGVTGWGEAGSALSYLTGHITPDYRGGVSVYRGYGRLLGSTHPGWFFETNADTVYSSRFGHDVLLYSQNRAGYTPEWAGVNLQLYWNANATADVKRQYWANSLEFGPGVKIRCEPMPDSTYFTVNLLRGVYTRNEGNPRRPNFFDFRAGFGYAFRY